MSYPPWQNGAKERINLMKIRSDSAFAKLTEDQSDMLVALSDSMTLEQLVKVVDFRGLFQLPAVMYCGFILHHSVHHRGQLSTYLRPMGSKVPAMYGESYDSAEAKKTAQKA